MEKLIRATDSMEDLEKEYWIELLPHMTSDQKEKLAKIIEVHDLEMQNLEKKYGKVMMDEEKVKHREIMIKKLTA